MQRLFFLCLAAFGAAAQPPATISLPKPDARGGMPLMQALNERKSVREFSPAKLPNEVLANLLWAAYGINRPDGRRTAPSASNRQTVDVYAVTADGAYLYNAREHRLDLVAAGDFRKLTGSQDFVATAPLNLVYVADYAKFANTPEESKTVYAASETGFIGQNVYLYCTSAGLASVVRAMVDRGPLARELKLRPEQRIILSHTVGYPREAAARGGR
jgi:SagB-type dehydrogenase family enzyme